MPLDGAACYSKELIGLSTLKAIVTQASLYAECNFFEIIGVIFSTLSVKTNFQMSIFYFLLPFKTNFELHFVQFLKDCQAHMCCPPLHTVYVALGWFFPFLFRDRQ